MKLKILICDDERNALLDIKDIVLKYTPKNLEPSLTCLMKTPNILNAVEKEIYDIAFLDIEMKDLNGITLATQLQQKNPNCLIIFITNYTTYVADAFHIKAFQYLYKPLDEEQFQTEYQRALRRYQRIRLTCSFQTLEGLITLQPRNILYVETYYHKMKLKTTNKTYLCSIKNKQYIIETLDNYDFIQVHQSYYVNMNHIYSIGHQDILLDNDEHLPLSLLRREEIKEQFHKFLVHQTLYD